MPFLMINLPSLPPSDGAAGLDSDNLPAGQPGPLILYVGGSSGKTPILFVSTEKKDKQKSGVLHFFRSATRDSG